MRALLATGALLLGIGLLLAGTAAGRAPAPLQVVEDEWTLVLSRQSVRAGPVLVEVVNFGQDRHDLVLQRRAEGAKPVRFPGLSPRTRAERTLRLAAGRYLLWCSLPGHRQRGMWATLAVRSG